MGRVLLLLACLISMARADVPAGTPIKLMLLKEISSHSSYPGDLVPMVVTQDVEVDGEIVIPEGTMVFAKVCQSRREGAFSAAVFDKPARLAIRLEHLRDAGGDEVKLRPQPTKEGDLQIVREMTVKPTAEEAKGYAAAWNNPKSRSVMEKVHRLFTDTATSLTQKEALVLIEHNVPLPVVQEAIRSGLFGEVMGIINDLKHGRALDAVLKLSPVTRPALIAVRAVRELGRLSGGIGNYFEGRFKGRNIRCAAGVELTVYAG